MWIYAPGTVKLCNDIPSWASINNDENGASSEMVGDVASSRGAVKSKEGCVQMGFSNEPISREKKQRRQPSH